MSVERHTEWRKRQVILPSEIRHRLEDWHGGQTSATYALASSSYRHLVSLSMIDMAVQELERVLGRETKGPKPHGLSGRTGLDKHDRKALSNVIDELTAVRLYWREYSAKEAGMEDHDEGYDTRDYGMTAEDEREIPTRSG